MPRANTFFQYIIKNKFSNCRQTLKQIGMGSPLGAANYYSLLQGAASLKRLGSTDLIQYMTSIFSSLKGEQASSVVTN